MLISNIYLSGNGTPLGKRNSKKFISSRVNGIKKQFMPPGVKEQETCDPSWLGRVYIMYP